MLSLHVKCPKVGTMCNFTSFASTDDFGGNLNEIYSQFSAKFQEYPFEANDIKLSLDKVTHCGHFTCNESM